MPKGRAHAKHWEVIKRTMRPEKGIKVNGKFYKYGTSGSFTVSDPGIARTMQKDHAADVLVAEVDKPRMDVSNNFFSLPELPWHKNRKPWYERRRPLKGQSNAIKEATGQKGKSGKPKSGAEAVQVGNGPKQRARR